MLNATRYGAAWTNKPQRHGAQAYSFLTPILQLPKENVYAQLLSITGYFLAFAIIGFKNTEVRHKGCRKRRKALSRIHEHIGKNS
jgi:hypothetical protein